MNLLTNDYLGKIQMKYYIFSAHPIFSCVFVGRFKFCYVDLHRAYFQNVKLNNLVFFGSDLRGAWIFSCEIKDCIFTEARFINLSITQSLFKSCGFYYNKVIFATFDRCSFIGCIEKDNLIIETNGFLEYWGEP